MKIGERFTLPAAAAEDVIAIVGRRGRGKTNTAVVLVEELHAEGARFCIADPVGVWWGLKSARNGKAAGIPVVVMGGEHKDVPLEETAGRVIADFVADKHSPSVILDFRGFRKAQMGRFMTDFLEQLYQRNREALHLVLDEADQFAPQRVMGETARLVGAAEDVCKMGRARGLLPILITQRPAALNKNVLTQAGLLIAHQLTGPQDQKAVDEWIRANADEAERAEFMLTIATLERGEAWFWQPELPIFKRVQVRERLTFDSSSTPQRGTRRAEPTTVAKVDLDALSEQIKATIERARADDPRELRKTIAELRAAYQPLAADLAPGGGPKEAHAALHRLKLQAAAVAVAVAKTAPSPIKAEHVKRLEAAAGRLEAALSGFLKAHARQVDTVAQRQQVVVAELAALSAALRTTPPAGRGIEALIPIGTPAREGRAAAGSPAPAASARPRPAAVARPGTPGDDAVRGGLRRMLIALAQRPGLTRRQLGLRAGIVVRGGSFRTYLSAGRVKGWIAESGDRFGVTRLGVTEAGLGALGAYEPLPEGADLLAHWMRELGGGGAARMLSALAAAYPKTLTREEVGAATLIEVSGGSFRTYLSKLRTLELVTGRDDLKASEELFS